jgi:hypothetical protein
MQLSIEELRAVSCCESNCPTLGFTVGRIVLVRTVTYHYTGIVTSVGDGAVVLSDAAWVAVSGRFADFLKSGDVEEVEPYPDGVHVNIALQSIVDWCLFPRTLREQK